MFFQNEIFDLFHTIYILGSLGITALIIYFLKYVKNEKAKDKILLTSAILTYILHLSPLWINFFKGEEAIAYDNMLLPIYFCNLSMFLLMVVALMKDKNTKTYRILATSTAYSAILGSMISLIYPEYYLSSDEGMTFGIMKSLLSHSTMLVGGIYLFTGGFVKITEKSIVDFIIGILIYGAVGALVNLSYRIFDLGKPNAMYMQGSAIEGVAILNGYFISVAMILVVFGINKLILFQKAKKVKLQPQG